MEFRHSGHSISPDLNPYGAFQGCGGGEFGLSDGGVMLHGRDPVYGRGKAALVRASLPC